MGYKDEELKKIFNGDKIIIDEAYETTKKRYSEKQANVAMYEYLQNNSTDYFTRTNNARNNMEKFKHHYMEIKQYLIEYAMSSYILNKYKCPFSLDEIHAYIRDTDGKLKYDKESVISVVDVGGADNAYWMSNLLSLNYMLKGALITNLIDERYTENKKRELDNANDAKLVTLRDGKQVMISKSRLNIDINNMIRDDNASYFKDDVEEHNKNRGK